MQTFFVIRNGWNSVNQPSAFAKRNPKNQFDSKQLELVAIVEATSEEEACKQFTGTVYNNQSLFATSNARSVKGLTKAIESFQPANVV